MQLLIAGLLGAVVGAVVMLVLSLRTRRDDTARFEQARARSAALTEEARSKSELLIKESELKAKDLLVSARAQAEKEIRERRQELTALETKLETREESFEKRVETFERREVEFNRREQGLRARETSLTEKEQQRQALIDEAKRKLEQVAGLTHEEAKRALIEEIVADARHDASRHIRIVEEEAKEEADRRAKRIITVAIERLAGEFVAERTVSTLALP